MSSCSSSLLFWVIEFANISKNLSLRDLVFSAFLTFSVGVVKIKLLTEERIYVHKILTK